MFDLTDFPLRNGKHCGYQLIRGTLAAYATGCSFCVFCDARCPDLIEAWYLPLFPLRFLEVQGLGESTPGNDARAAAQLNDIEVQFDKQPDENRFIRSDEASFVKYGIPSLAFKFGWLPNTFNDWIKTRYHRPSDDANQSLSLAGVVQFDHALATLATRIANTIGRPSWYPESFFSTFPKP